MKFIVKNSYLVKPAEPTWSGSIPMSELDHTGVLTDVQIIYFYKPSKTWLTPHDRIFKTLNNAFTKALVHFYPLAGRLRWLNGGRLELDCNNEGVELIEAETAAELADLGELMSPSPDWEYLIPQFDYVSVDLHEIPLMSVQLTKFGCGGVSLSFTTSHVAADGLSAIQFITALAAVCRGEAIGELPCFETKLLRAGESVAGTPRFHHPEFEPPPLIVGQQDGELERRKETTNALLKLSKMQVEALKNEANKTRQGNHATGRPYTRYEAITAHVWRCACKARRHVHNQSTVMAVTVDIRRRVVPPLPRTYFFNGVLQMIAKGQSGEVTAEPLGYVAGKIRDAIDRVTNEHVQSAIDYLKNVEDISHLQDWQDLKNENAKFYGNPCLGVVSWIGFPLQGMDFGWGKEIFMAPRTHDDDGDMLILPSCDGDDSVIVALCLQTECMDDFKKFMYEDIPSVGY